MADEKLIPWMADVPGVEKFFKEAKESKLPEVPSRVSTPEIPEVEVDLRPRSKEERYLDTLKEFELNRESAAEIVDAIITKFYWEEEVNITKKLKVVFRTRTSKVLKLLNAGLTKMNPQYDNTYYGIITQYNLAGSLTKYGTSDLNPEKDFERSLDFVERLPGPLFIVLSEKLRTFDRKVQAVMQEGMVENF